MGMGLSSEHNRLKANLGERLRRANGVPEAMLVSHGNAVIHTKPSKSARQRGDDARGVTRHSHLLGHQCEQEGGSRREQQVVGLEEELKLESRQLAVKTMGWRRRRQLPSQTRGKEITSQQVEGERAMPCGTRYRSGGQVKRESGRVDRFFCEARRPAFLFWVGKETLARVGHDARGAWVAPVCLCGLAVAYATSTGPRS